MSVAVVIPTIGRPCLSYLIASVERNEGPRPECVVVVDDRPDASGPLVTGAHGWIGDLLQVRRSGGRGPAAARNVGWRHTHTDWVAFLDDDVVVDEHWLADLDADLDVPAQVAGVQGVVSVPLPAHRRPTDWERGTAGLATARWITADMAYRRDALTAVGGFDERFPRAFREDADIALRMIDAGRDIVTGSRRVTHPVREAAWNASVRQQRGNADDALMRVLHGADWHERAAAPVGRRPVHIVTTAAALVTAAGAAARKPALAGAAATVWAACTARFAAERILPGPRDPQEVAAMTATSVAIPPLATWHWLRGVWRHRGARPWQELARRPVSAVLFDRDGTLIHDVPYNGDPDLVDPVPDARAAVEAARRAGVRVGVVTNQSGVARKLITDEQVRATNARVDELVGPMDTWQVCPHDDAAGCSCRKPLPGMVHAASRELGVPVDECVVIGDTAADVAAAEAAGAIGVLVPNAATRPEEVLAATLVFDTVLDAVDTVLSGAHTSGRTL